MKVPATLRPALEIMLGDLETQWLVVSKEPSSRGGFIRVVHSQNPGWYQQLCGGHAKVRSSKRHPRKRQGHRKHDTKIVRARVESVIRTMLKTGRSSSIYAGEILGYARGILDEIAAMNAAYEEAELQELGFTRSQLDRMEDAPF